MLTKKQISRQINLVEEVRRNGSVAARYKYLADGTKLEAVSYTHLEVYKRQVQYHVTDYLGSVRVVADQNGRALEKITSAPCFKSSSTTLPTIFSLPGIGVAEIIT